MSPTAGTAVPSPTLGAAPQVIGGTVVDSASQLPVPGAVITLEAGEGLPVQRFLAGPDGHFQFIARRPGTYALHAERLGMTEASFDGLRLGATDTLNVRLLLQVSPVALDGLNASGARRCELRADIGEATQRVWDAARKALTATDLAESTSRFTFVLERHLRELDPVSLRVREEARTVRRTAVQRPIEARPAELLAQQGFVLREAGEDRYFAPDARVLLSDEFLATHCLAVRAGRLDEASNPSARRGAARRSRNDPATGSGSQSGGGSESGGGASSGRGADSGIVGLEFRPVRIRTDQTDVQGTLWLARATGDPLWLEFSYVNLPDGADEARGGGSGDGEIGGRVDFRGMPGGTWIVSSWHIRMPRVSEEIDPIFGSRRLRLAGIVEEGGRVVRADWAGTTSTGPEVAYLAAGGVIEGVVTDPHETVPQAAVPNDPRSSAPHESNAGRSETSSGVRVALVGTGFETEVDPNGRFAFEGLPQGAYRVAFRRPQLAGLDRGYSVAEVVVVPRDTATVAFEAPHPDSVLARVCAAAGDGSGDTNGFRPDTGVIQGHVFAGGAGRIAQDAPVIATWQEVTAVIPQFRASERSVATRTNALGEFRICGVPRDGTTVEVVASVNDVEVSQSVVLSTGRPVSTVVLTVPR